MVCDKCNKQMKATYGPQYKNNKGQLYRSILLKCYNCNAWKQEIEYIEHKEVNGIIETVYRIKR